MAKAKGLLTWTDGVRPPSQGKGHRPDGDLGPVMRLLAHRRPYGRARVLTTPRGLQATRGLVARMSEHIPKVELCLIDIDDPSDHGKLFRELGPVIQTLDPDYGWEVCLSAGTPQAQTLWVILNAAKLLRATLLQVIPPIFVPDPHPHPVREVHLDIDGFPEIRALKEEVRRLRSQTQSPVVIGHSEAMMDLMRRTRLVAQAEVPVLIRGETGTGKELVARQLHQESLRREGPFVAESCGALPEGVLLSALFGHEAGAFTGAESRHRGLFEMAHGGSLFLDEVGEMPPRVQGTLLRVLQEGQLRRVGGEATVPVDVRVITATHRDLGAMVAEGTFRQDLYYRLRGVELEVPALRERLEDLKALIRHFLMESGADELTVTPGAWAQLMAYPWPGNVRECRAEVLRWGIFCEKEVGIEALSKEIRGVETVAPPQPTASPSTSLRGAVEAVEQQVILQILEQTKWNLSASARSLGIDRNTLKRKIARYGLKRASG